MNTQLNLAIATLCSTIIGCAPNKADKTQDLLPPSDIKADAQENRERPFGEKYRIGETVFDIHDPQYGCGEASPSAFGCLQQSCRQAGGNWDADGKQCLCGDGVILSQGERAECQRSPDGKRLTDSIQLFVSNREFPLVFAHGQSTPSLGRHGGTILTDAQGYFGNPLYRSPQYFEHIIQKRGAVADEPQNGDIFLNSLNLVIDSMDEMGDAMTRRPFSSKAPSIVQLGRFESSLESVTNALQQYSTLRALPEPHIVFMSRSGGCATGCRVHFALPSTPKYEAHLVRDYFWGAIGFEAIDLSIRFNPHISPQRLRIFLLPSGKVSHIVGETLPLGLSAHGSGLGSGTSTGRQQ